MTDHLTTENTGHYAGIWYDLPDGTKRYFTREYVAEVAARESRSMDRDLHATAIPARALVNGGKYPTKADAPRAVKADLPLCEICKTHPIRNRKSKTCGNPECAVALTHKTQAAQKQKTQAA